MNLHCRHFPRCGGCQILDLGYAAQLLRKQEEVARHFADWPSLRVDPILPSPRVEGYRHKVQLPFGRRRSPSGARITLGCYAAGSHAVVDQEECLVQEPGLSRAAWAVRRWAGEENLSVYREDTGTGWLRHLVLRRGEGTGEVLLGLVTNGPGPDMAERVPALVRAVRAALSAGGGSGELAGVVQNLNPERTNVVLGGEERLLWGRPFLRETLGPFTFPVGLSTFFQVNPFQTPRLYDRVLTEVPAGARVLDLYCGMGSISLWVSRRAGHVLGIEENPASVAAAARAARDNGVDNADFLASDAARALAGMEPGGRDARRFEAAIVDPPRKGLEAPVRDSLRRLGLDRIVYVSCFPATLARDVRAWEGAFRLRSVTPVDMFPHTLHVECVAVLEAV